MIKNARGDEIDENRYEAYSYYSLYGDFDPDEISRRTGFPRTVGSRRIGELGKYSKKKPAKFAMWSLQSTLDRTNRLEKHIEDVLRQLDTNPEVFIELSRIYGGTMQLVGYFFRYPGIHFDKNIIVALARYGLSVDFDLYFPGPEDFL